MEWDKNAANEFIRMPLAKSAKANAKLFAEKMARKSHRKRVILKDLEAAKKVTYGNISAEKRQRDLDRRVAEGETDLSQRMEQEGREVLTSGIDLFKVVLCPGESARCPNLNIELEEIKKELEMKLRALKVTEMMADIHGDDEQILAHHRVTISISGCPIGCTAPEVRSFSIQGVAKPKITDVVCNECYSCVDSCWQGAIIIRGGGPQINKSRCDFCECCVRACPTGKLVSEKRGYRIMVGGRFGRLHQVGSQLFRIADKKTLMAVVEAAVRTIREEADGYEDLTSVVNRIGVGPIFQRMYQQNEKD